jgi:membrane-anchored glycerophosphoryl diester phosphodiesterase (GDPDase)
MFEIWLANFSAWLVSWMAFSFAFGAICIALDETQAGFTPSAWHSLRNVRERLGPFLRISLLLFVLLLVAQAASALLGTGVFWILHQLQVRRSRFAILMVSCALVGPSLARLLAVRLIIAIPAVILDDCRVGQAMFRSEELTEGKWLTLAVVQ